MCGFAGRIGPGAPLGPPARAAVLAALAPRGPDGAGHAHHRAAHLSLDLLHRRLAVVAPGPEGRQPFAAPGDLLLVWQGELYDLGAHRRRLAAAGHPLRTRTDTEALAALYRAHGPEVFAGLEGQFALALFDRPRQRLILARDRFGIAPLHLAHRPDGDLLFGSTPRALLATGRLPLVPDRAALAELVTTTFIAGGATGLAGIEALPPGAWAVWTPAAGLRVTPAAPLRLAGARPPGADAAPSPPPDPEPDLATAARAVRHHLERAVARRLVADVPVGVALSGGLDSSAVLALARAHGAAPPAVTASVVDADHDERPHAEAVARAAGVPCLVAPVRPDPDAVRALAQALGRPFADSSALAAHALFATARAAGLRVLLTGDGGDEVFAGYRTHQAWAWARRLGPLLRAPGLGPAALALLRRAADGLPRRGARHGLDLRLRQFAAAAHLPPAAAHAAYKRFLPAAWAAPLFGDLPLPDLEGAALRLAAAHPHAGLDAILHLDLVTYLPDDILTKTDLCSLAHGVEARLPYLDGDLFACAAALPAHLKLGPLHLGPLATKRVLRRAVAEVVPGWVRRRPKAGMNIPVSRWLRGPLFALLADTLGARTGPAADLWHRPTVAAMLAAHRSGRADLGRPLWALMLTALSLQDLSLLDLSPQDPSLYRPQLHP